MKRTIFHSRTNAADASPRGDRGDVRRTIPVNRNVGRMRKWPTVEHLRYEVDKYFESCLSRKWVTELGENGEELKVEEVEQKRPFTMSGLALYLKITRSGLLYWESADEDYFFVIQEARSRCEAFAEETLYSSKSMAGVMFSMKNNFEGWNDTRSSGCSSVHDVVHGPEAPQLHDDAARASRARLLSQSSEDLSEEVIIERN